MQLLPLLLFLITVIDLNVLSFSDMFSLVEKLINNDYHSIKLRLIDIYTISINNKHIMLVWYDKPRHFYQQLLSKFTCILIAKIRSWYCSLKMLTYKKNNKKINYFILFIYLSGIPDPTGIDRYCTITILNICFVCIAHILLLVYTLNNKYKIKVISFKNCQFTINNQP